MVKITKTFVNGFLKDPETVLRSLSLDDVVSLIQEANNAYYNKGKPLFSDQLYDYIKTYIENIDPHHPVLKNIGAVVGKGNKVKLPYFMGSLDKIKSDDKALSNWMKTFGGTYVVSDKLDGNSGLLVYTNGVLNLYTRGDGEYGQDITHLIPFLKNKATLNASVNLKEKGNFAIRGELIMSKTDFKTVASKGANARNMVAGLLNAKVPDLQIASLTAFVGYEVLSPSDLLPKQQLEFIKSTGIDSVYYTQLTEKQMKSETLSDILLNRRDASPYEIDGIVITHNNVHPKTSQNPEYAFAFKSVLTMETAEVTVTRVEWNMSKDAIYVPVVHFTPVSLDGVVITKAHGFNGKYIQDNSIGPGAIVLIMRSGAVIPYIIKTIIKADTPQFPNTSFVWTASGVDIKLDTNKSTASNNDELQLRNIIYFFEKINVDGLSEGILSKMYKSGHKTVGGIFNVSKDQLLEIEGFQVKLATKIHEALNERKKKLDPIVVMDASNVLGRGIGYKKIKLICDAFPSILKERYIPSIQELIALKGIEQKTASLFVNNLSKAFVFFDENQLDLTASTKDDTSFMTLSKSKTQGLQNKVFVFTGVRDKVLEKVITDNGGTVGTTISSKTHVVIVKSLEFQSSKVDKAKQLGVNIMLLDDFRKELGL